MTPSRVASIDLGTNTALLLVVDVEKDGIRVVHDEARITRLGEKLHEQKKFIPSARARVLAALKDYQSRCDDLGVGKIMAVGTAAFRKAENAEEFVDEIKNETGIAVDIISGEEEARLSYLSAEKDFGEKFENLYVLDIGGGSTEIISNEGGISFDIGGVILTESIVKHDIVTEEEYLEMKTRIDSVVGTNSSRIQPKNPTLIGLAGSVTTLSAIKQKLAQWDGSKVQGSVLTLNDVDQMIADFRKMSLMEKSQLVGMVKGREDTILAGTMILQAMMKKLGVSQVVVSDRGLRFGNIYQKI